MLARSASEGRACGWPTPHRGPVPNTGGMAAVQAAQLLPSLALRANGLPPGWWALARSVRIRRSTETEHEIDDPAAADVRSRTATVCQDIDVGAASLFQGVGQDR